MNRRIVFAACAVALVGAIVAIAVVFSTRAAAPSAPSNAIAVNMTGPFSGSLQLSMCDQAGLTRANANLIGSRYSYIVDNRYQGKPINVSLMHSLNPNIKILVYQDSLFFFTNYNPSIDASAYLTDTTDSGTPSNPALVVASENPTSGAGWSFFMRPENAYWQQYVWNQQLAYFIATYHYDGIQLDDTWACVYWNGSFNPRHPIPHWISPAGQTSGTPTAYTSLPSFFASWANNLKGNVAQLLSFVATQMKTLYPDKLISFNGLNEAPWKADSPAYSETAFVQYSTGFSMESAISQNGNELTYDDGVVNAWSAAMNAWLNSYPGKTVAWQNYDPQERPSVRLYTLGSFLLTQPANGSASYGFQPSCLANGFYPEHYLDYGVANDTRDSPQPTSIKAYFDSSSGCYFRNYTNAVVIVNPTAVSCGPFNLGLALWQVQLSGGNLPAGGGNGFVSFSLASSSPVLLSRTAAIFLAKIA